MATVGTKPESELKDYKGFPVKKGNTEISEGDLDKAMGNLREHFAQFTPVEDRPSRMDDLLTIDFDGKIDGKPFEGGKASGNAVLLGGQNLLKDFEDHLVGMKKGETKTFPLTFPADYSKKEVAGKSAEFTVTLTEIKEKKLPALDDEFAKAAGNAATLSELQEKLKVQLKANREVEERGKMVEQVGEQLMKAHPFDIPLSLVHAEQQRLIQQGVERMRSQGFDARKLTDNQKTEFVESLRPVAEKNVHMALIVERIAEAEKIRCEERDFEAYLDRVSKGLNQPVEAVRGYIHQKGNKEGVQEMIQYEKTLDFLVAASKIETV